MSSPIWASLEAHIGDLEQTLIATIGSAQDKDAQIKATAFRVLASAAIEGYVEERCSSAAQTAVLRLNQGQYSAAGRALVIWYTARKNPRMIPIHEDDIPELYDLYEEAGKAYLDAVKSTHGMSRRDFTNLVYPMGVREQDLPGQLLDQLQSLSDTRDPAVHTTRIRIKNNIDPSMARSQVMQIVTSLSVVDDLLTHASDNFPIRA